MAPALVRLGLSAYPGRVVRVPALAAVLLAGACGDPETALFVDLVTDFVPVVELTAVRVEVDRDGVPPIEHAVAPDADYVEGVRVATVRGLAAGRLSFRVVLTGEGDQTLVERPVVIDLSGRHGTTIVVTRSCGGLGCPTEDDPAATACRAGECVDPGCTEETPAACGVASLCGGDADCPGAGAGCASSRCRGGVCLVGAVAGGCPAGQACHPELGCVAATARRCDGFVAVSTGDQHSCAIRGSGELFCWGRDSRGQLGVVDDFDHTLPARVEGEGWVAVSAGRTQTCGVRDGEAFCWGHNDDGELGVGDRDPRAEPARVVDGPFDVVSIGRNHGCGVRASDRALWCWGDNEFGQLGDGTTADAERPVVVDPERWLDVQVGDDHTCALREDRSVWCFGRDRDGQLGNGPGETGSLVPSSVLGPVAAFTVGTDHVCVLHGAASDETSCWGDGSDGRLGVGGLDDAHAPTRVEGAPPLSFLDAGDDHGCGVARDGSLWCWGSNSAGQLGVEGASRDTPIRVGERTDWAIVSAGGDHTCAIDDRGRLYCWGDNLHGQLGGGDTRPHASAVQVCPL